jgi:hypothetical protein
VVHATSTVRCGLRLTLTAYGKCKKCQKCDGRDTVRVTSVSIRHCKRHSIFATEERGNAKIELLSPRCIAIVPQRLLPGTLLTSEADAAWSGEPPPPARDDTACCRPSSCTRRRCPSSCALPWVEGIPDPVSPLLLCTMTRQGAAPPSAPGGRLERRPSICVRRRHEQRLWQGSWLREQDILLQWDFAMAC